jgi:hypothetical protein
MYVHACAHTRAREIVWIFIHLSIHLSKWIIYLSMYLSIYIHIASCINVCTRMRAHARERDSMYIHTSIYPSIYIHSDIYPSIYLYTCMQIHIWMYAHACMRTHAKEILCVWKQNHSMRRLVFFLSCECSMPHIWMSHVTHMNESCHTYEWVMSHMKELCCTYECIILTYEEVSIFAWRGWYFPCLSLMWTQHAAHMNEWCHTCEWVMSHIWICHAVHANVSWARHVWMSYVAHMDE